jgi:hypothetical protein
MIGAISITNAQSNVVDIIFNFGAILIIADLDSILIKTFPIKKIQLLVPSHFEMHDISFYLKE